MMMMKTEYYIEKKNIYFEPVTVSTGVGEMERGVLFNFVCIIKIITMKNVCLYNFLC